MRECVSNALHCNFYICFEYLSSRLQNDCPRIYQKCHGFQFCFLSFPHAFPPVPRAAGTSIASSPPFYLSPHSPFPIASSCNHYPAFH